MAATERVVQAHDSLCLEIDDCSLIVCFLADEFPLLLVSDVCLTNIVSMINWICKCEDLFILDSLYEQIKVSGYTDNTANSIAQRLAKAGNAKTDGKAVFKKRDATIIKMPIPKVTESH
jgi:hypothetical protein